MNRTMRLTGRTIWLMIGLLLCRVATAGLEGPRLPIATASHDQQNARVVALPDRDLWLVVWEDWSLADTPIDEDIPAQLAGSEIRGQFYRSSGESCGDELHLSAIQTVSARPARNGNQTAPTVAYNGKGGDAGRLLVSWQSSDAFGQALVAVSVWRFEEDEECSLLHWTHALVGDWESGSERAPVSYSATARTRLVSEGNDFGNSSAMAESVLFNAYVAGTLAGSDDADWLRFTVPQRDSDLDRVADPFNITLGYPGVAPAGWQMPQVRLMANDRFLSGSEISERSAGTLTISHDCNIACAASQEFYLRLSWPPSVAAGGTSSLDYRVSIGPADRAESGDSDTSHNDTEAAAELLFYNNQIAGRIGASDDIDWYRFEVPLIDPDDDGIAKSFTVRLGYPGVEPSGWQAPDYVLRDEAGDLLNTEFTEDSDGNIEVKWDCGGICPVSHQFFLQLTWPAAPPAGASPPLDYRVSVGEPALDLPSSVINVAAGSEDHIENDASNDAASASTILIGDTITGSLATATDEDWYTITVPAGDSRVVVGFNGMPDPDDPAMGWTISGPTTETTTAAEPVSFTLTGGSSDQVYRFGIAAAANWKRGVADYQLTVKVSSQRGLNKKLLYQRTPVASYNPVKDQFLLAWIEGRDQQQHLSEICFNRSGLELPATWNVGDQASIIYGGISPVRLALNQQSDLFFDGPYRVSNDFNGEEGTRSIRRLSRSFSEMEEVYLYEYFTDLGQLALASDPITGESLLAWDGEAWRATLTCSCTDLPEDAGYTAGSCESSGIQGAEPRSHTLVTERRDIVEEGESTLGGGPRIQTIPLSRIPLASLPARRLDGLAGAGNHNPAIGVDPVRQRFLVAWEDYSNGVGQIRARLLVPGGGTYGSELVLGGSDLDGDGEIDPHLLTTRQSDPVVAYDTTHQRFAVVWQDGRNSRTSLENLDLYGQYVDFEGSLRGDNLPIAVATGTQAAPALAYHRGSHQFLAVWKDSRGANQESSSFSDVLGQRFSLGQPQLNLLRPDDTPLVPPLLNFGMISAGERGRQTIKLVNSGDTFVTVDCVAPYPVSEPFAYTFVVPEPLQNCGDGETLQLVPSSEYLLGIDFNPTAAATAIDQFSVISDAGEPTIFLQGIATEGDQDGRAIIISKPAEVDCGTIGASTTRSIDIDITNQGSADATVTFIDPPSEFSPFSLVGLDSGSVIPAGESVAAVVRCDGLSVADPVASRSSPIEESTPFSAEVGLVFNAGVKTLRIPLAVTVLPGVVDEVDGSQRAVLVAAPERIDCGTINTVSSRSYDIDIVNQGNAAATLNFIDPPAGNSPFSLAGIDEGAVIQAGGTVAAVVRCNGISVADTLEQEGHDQLQFNTDLGLLFNAGVKTLRIPLAAKVVTGVTSEGGEGEVETALITSSPDRVDCGSISTSSSLSVDISILNSGNKSASITFIDTPTENGPFALAGIEEGAVIPAGGAVAAVVRCDGTGLGDLFGADESQSQQSVNYESQIGLLFDSGTKTLRIPLKATVVPPASGGSISSSAPPPVSTAGATISGWRVVDYHEGGVTSHDDILWVESSPQGVLTASWGAYSFPITYRDGIGFSWSFSNDFYSWNYLITAVDATGAVGSWGYEWVDPLTGEARSRGPFTTRATPLE